MQKWEHKWLQLGPLDNHEKILNELGQEGWETYQALVRNDGSPFGYLLKRPIEEETFPEQFEYKELKLNGLQGRAEILNQEARQGWRVAARDPYYGNCLLERQRDPEVVKLEILAERSRIKAEQEEKARQQRQLEQNAREIELARQQYLEKNAREVELARQQHLAKISEAQLQAQVAEQAKSDGPMIIELNAGDKRTNFYIEMDV